MFRQLLALVSLGLCASGVLAAVVPPPFACGNEAPPPELLAEAGRLQKNKTQPEGGDSFRVAALVVDTYFHIVTTAAKRGSVSSSQVTAQVTASLPPPLPFQTPD